MNNYTPIIGLEIHTELTTNSKLFCRCPNTSNDLTSPPNSAICPVCLGLPGALPVLNKKAVESTVTLGRSLGSTIPESTKWDRKNYFYPDLPKGYQISQYDEPLCQGGELSWLNPATNQKHSVSLTRIHLEEDTGKLTHPEGSDYSLIDYNRSSIPLLELVTEPVIGSAEEAKQFGEEYQRHLRELKVAEANMEKGQMRCEANVSVVPEDLAGDPTKRLSGTKVEIKNLNSFRSLERAIVYEVKRQSEVLASGGTIRQETRGWNETKGETYVMRAKETADDYRYFPEPDLGRLDLHFISAQDENSGLSRAKLLEILQSEGLDAKQITISMNDPKRLALWGQLLDVPLEKSLFALALQWINQEPALLNFSAIEISSALARLNTREITPAIFKSAIMSSELGELSATIENLKEEDSVENLDEVVEAVLAANQPAVDEYRAGKIQLLGFFVGQVRKSLGGKGDAITISHALKKRLDKEV